MLQLIKFTMILSLFLIASCTNSNSHMKDQFLPGNPGAEPEPTVSPELPDPTPTPTFTYTPTPTFTLTPTPTSTPTPLPPDCDFDHYQELVPKACLGHTMTVACDIVAETIKTNTKVVMTATKKNGGTGGSRFYDAKATFVSLTSVLLPATINVLPGGKAGNGQKLYLYFDNDVTCSYRSHANTKYITPVCKLNGQIDPGKTDGFAVGIGSYILDVSHVDDILSVHAHVNGASGNGTVTTVKFDLIFD